MDYAKRRIRRVGKLLRSAPRPLADVEKRLIVLWAPKSACTTTYVWFSCLCGFVDEVRAYAGFPGTHRVEVYTKSERFRRALEADTRGFHVLRVIRDPYARAISIFRQALTVGFADEELAREEMDFATGVSFRTFLEFAALQKMRKANIHLRPQLHRYESRHTPDTVINISKADMFEQLNALEARMGWPVTDFKSMGWLHRLENSRRAACERFEGEEVDTIPIIRATTARNTRFPEYGQLLTPPARALIEEIYQDDFEAYRDFL